MVFQCCVRGCGIIATNGLQSFPSNKLVAEKWIMAIKANHLMERLHANKLSHSHRKVCKKHFKQSDFQSNVDGKSQLVKNSIPSLFLPEGEDTFDSTNIKKPLKRLQQEHSKVSKPNIGASQRSKNQPTHENDRNVEMVLSCSLNEVKTNTGVDLNHSTKNLSKNRNRSGHGVEIMKQSNLARKLRYRDKRITELEQKVRDMKKDSKLNDTKVINYLSKKINKHELEFVKMQLENSGRSKHGRRYTSEQKSLCLAIYKQGPKSYRFKETLFTLPTKKTLGRHSADLLFKSGVDSNVFEVIKEIVTDWPQNDRYCTISWDEVSLKEHLDYSQSRDIIEGFVELAESRRSIFATHALTFMVRGINVSFKQAVGYFYTNGLKAFELVELVQLMIEAVLSAGLITINSVCDQVNINKSTVYTLINPANPSKVQDGQLLLYKIKGQEIIHCFDPSHLIKTARNNLEKKDLIHSILKRWHIGDTNNIADEPQIASWDYVFALYRMDTQSSQRCLPKLTDEHLTPNKLKMRVSLATQIFSNTCGTVMLRCIEQSKLPEHYAGTAQILLFMNDLFDSINGSDYKKGDTLKSAVKANSIHFTFWEYALKMLSKMYFVDKLTGERNNRSSVLKKFESTIKGYMEFSKLCFKLSIPKVSIRSKSCKEKIGILTTIISEISSNKFEGVHETHSIFKIFVFRNTSQDGLENFFGCVNSCSQANKPTPRQYCTGYGTMTINNITGTNSLHSNCEPDTSTAILTNIDKFILDFKTRSNNYSNNDVAVDEMIVDDVQSDLEENFVEQEITSINIDADEMIVFDPQFEETELNFTEREAVSHTSNLVCQKLMKFASCQECKIHLQLITENDDTLSTTETIFSKNCKKVLCDLNELIPHVCSEESLKKKLIEHIQAIEIDSVGCLEHDIEMAQKLKELCAQNTITTFCYDINKFLSKKIKILPPKYNHIQKLAFDHVNKKKKIGKYSDIFNAD